MKILIAGGAGFKNSGDEALLRTAFQVCRHHYPNAQLTLVANNQEVAQSTIDGFDYTTCPSPRFAFFHGDHHYGSADSVFQERWNLLRNSIIGNNVDEACRLIDGNPSLQFVNSEDSKRFLRTIAASDVLIIHGGGILTSATRSRLWEQSLTIEIAAQWGKKVLLRSHQYGPYTHKDDLSRIETIVKCSNYMSSRDLGQSSEEIKRNFSFQIVDQVDDALILDGSFIDAQKILSLHNLIAKDYICVGYRFNPSVGIDDTCFQKTADIVSTAQNIFGVSVVLLPQGPFDRPGLLRLSKLLSYPVKIIDPVDHFKDPLVIAENAKLMIAMPHHSLIFALRGGVPIVSPVMGEYYKFKNIGSMRFFGLEKNVIDIESDTFLKDSEYILRNIHDNYNSICKKLKNRVEELRRVAGINDSVFASKINPI